LQTRPWPFRDIDRQRQDLKSQPRSNYGRSFGSSGLTVRSRPAGEAPVLSQFVGSSVRYRLRNLKKTNSTIAQPQRAWRPSGSTLGSVSRPWSVMLGGVGTIIEMADCPRWNTERRRAFGGAAVAKRTSRAMSHHRACCISGAAHRSQQPTFNNAAGASDFYTRRRSRFAFIDLRVLLLFLVFLAWTSLLGTASAQEIQAPHGDRQRSASLPAAPVNDIAWKGPSLLVVDTRPPPPKPLLMHLQRRGNDEKASGTTTAAASKTTIDTDSSSTSSAFAIPEPFDTSLSNNYTSSCATFLKTLLSNKTVQDCHPFSLLLQVCARMPLTFTYTY
jgi:hypothetical protein